MKGFCVIRESVGGENIPEQQVMKPIYLSNIKNLPTMQCVILKIFCTEQGCKWVDLFLHTCLNMLQFGCCFPWRHEKPVRKSGVILKKKKKGFICAVSFESNFCLDLWFNTNRLMSKTIRRTYLMLVKMSNRYLVGFRGKEDVFNVAVLFFRHQLILCKKKKRSLG